jgi:drug/metabolite transporter (DMT)-like permease
LEKYVPILGKIFFICVLCLIFLMGHYSFIHLNSLSNLNSVFAILLYALFPFLLSILSVIFVHKMVAK